MKADIRLGSTRIIGSTAVDEKFIRGEGGADDPRLVIPVTFTMHSQREEHMLVVTDGTALLYLGDGTSPAHQVGLAGALDVAHGYWARSSIGTAPNEHQVQVPIPLNSGSVRRLEAARHTAADLLVLTLALHGRVAWVRDILGPGMPGVPITHDPFQGVYGTHSLFSYFWTVDFATLRLVIDQSAWVRNVLPGLGVDNLRLVEVNLPPDLDDVGNSAKAYDIAMRAYQERKYSDCIEECRVIVNAWNRRLGSTKQKPIGDALGDRRHWSLTDPRRLMLSSIWQALLDFLDKAHHQENPAHVFDARPEDAQLVLRQVAILSEYLK